MRRTIIAAVAACLAFAAHAQDGQAGDDVALDTPKQRFSYGMGMRVARSMVEQGVPPLDAAAFALAISDTLGGKDYRLTIPELQAAMVAYQQEVAAESTVQAEKARARGETFLAGNRDGEGVTELDTGLQYRVVTAGEGEMPSETDTVVVHYAGKLLDGSEFDSSYSRGAPTTLEVGQVIPGWQQALQLMPVGSKWEIWVPSDLAYGANGAGGRIGPNETLHFEIELIEIQ